MLRKTLAALATAALLGLSTTAVVAQNYPDRPIRMIVPFSAGGATDTPTRLVMKKVGEQLGQTVVVENKPGAGGALGYSEVARSKPDGYTLTVASAHLPLMGLIYDKLPFDPVTDIVSVAPMANVPIALVASSSAPFKTMAEMLDYARKNPSTSLAYGSPGVSTPQHLAGVLLATMAGIKLEHVPYKGGMPAVQDVMAGSIPLAFIGLSTAIAQAETGRIRILGAGGAKRSLLAPNVPTIAEGGVPGYEASYWIDISVVKGTPEAIVNRLHAEITKAVQNPEVQEGLRKGGFEPLVMSPGENQRALKEQAAKWGKVIRENNIRAGQ